MTEAAPLNSWLERYSGVTATEWQSVACTLPNLLGHAFDSNEWLGAMASVFEAESKPAESTVIACFNYDQKEAANYLQQWINKGEATSQRQFWRFFDRLTGHDTSPSQDIYRSKFSSDGQVDKFLVDVIEALRPRPPKISLMMGQVSLHSSVLHEVNFDKRDSLFNRYQRDLSNREILAIWRSVIKQVNALDGLDSFASFVSSFREILVEKVSSRVRWRITSVCSQRRRSFDYTHDFILSFVFRTGNPPPSSGIYLPGVGWTPSSIFIFVRGVHEVENETVRRPESRRYLRVAQSTGRSPERFCRCVYNLARARRCAQPQRRRRYWSSISATRFTRSAEYSCLGEVASNFPVGHRKRRK